MLTVSPVVDSPALHVGEIVRVEWTIPLDVPPSAVEVRPGPCVADVGSVEKSSAGIVDGEPHWTYAVRVQVGAVHNGVELAVPGQRVRTVEVKAARRLTEGTP